MLISKEKLASMNLPRIEIDLMNNCSCDNYKAETLKGRYIGTKTEDPKEACAILDIQQSYDDIIKKCRKAHKGSIFKKRNKFKKQGFVCTRFHWKDYIEDIYYINMSKEVRSGGPMRSKYKRSIEQLREESLYMIESTTCKYHWAIPWGIIDPSENKLIGYISLLRIGEIVLYNMILGHGDYTKYGIIANLHFTILDWFYEEHNEYTHKLKYVMYGGYFQGYEGLKWWKDSAAFSPFLLIEK